jgi:glycosyltransferase involved in cell wall biosynthesis
MRILHITANLSGGGAERQLCYLAPALVRMGHHVHIAYSKLGPENYKLPGVNLHRLHSKSNYDPRLLWEIRKLVIRVQPDIIQTWILRMDILGGIIARGFGIPWALREPSSSSAYSWTWKYYFRVLIASGAKAIISNSRSGIDYWKKQLPSAPRYMVRNGLPLNEIDQAIPSLPFGGMGSKIPIVLYAGRLASDTSAKKNLRFFLHVLAKVKKRKKFIGVLCGDGPQRAELTLLKNKLGLDNDLHLTGYIASGSVWSLMKKASIFVSLSEYEGSPNAVMEAMACGCQMILSDIPGHREVADEDCAIFVDPSDIQQTANTIIMALSDPNTLKERSIIAKQRARQWSIPEMSESYESVYKRIM